MGRKKSLVVGGETLDVGVCVAVRSPSGGAPFIARIQTILDTPKGSSGATNVRVTWFYRPEDARGGRKPFHGEKELFQSDHADVITSDTINGMCRVHTLKQYQALSEIGEMDYFSRFTYKATTGRFSPDSVPVYCVCEMPYNPDLSMVECEGCEEWLHPECLGLTERYVKKMDHFVCAECTKKHLEVAAGKKRKVR